MKKIVMAGLLCCVMLTGCGMPDKVSDMLQDIDVEMLNTEEEIDAAIEQVSDGEEAWVLSQRRQQQILELKEFLVEQKKKGVIKIEYDDEFLIVVNILIFVAEFCIERLVVLNNRLNLADCLAPMNLIVAAGVDYRDVGE